MLRTINFWYRTTMQVLKVCMHYVYHTPHKSTLQLIIKIHSDPSWLFPLFLTDFACCDGHGANTGSMKKNKNNVAFSCFWDTKFEVLLCSAAEQHTLCKHFTKDIVRFVPFLSSAGACPSQTQQQSQTLQEGEDLGLCRKKKRQNKKNPYHYLTSLLHRRQSEEDQTGILASADSEGPNYGTLRWPCLNHQAIGPLNLPSASKREAWPRPFAAPDIELLRRFSSKSVGVFLGKGDARATTTRAEHSAGAGRRSHPGPEQWLFFFF